MNTQGPEDWVKLYTKLQHWSFNWWLSNGFSNDAHTRELVIECAQDAIARIATSTPPQTDNIDAWYYGVLRNACRIAIKHKYRYEEFLDKRSFIADSDYSEDLLELLIDTASTPEDRLIAEETKSIRLKALKDAMQKLNYSDQSLLTRFYFQGASIGRLAEDLNVSKSIVSSRKHNALKRLAKYLPQDDINKM